MNIIKKAKEYLTINKETQEKEESKGKNVGINIAAGYAATESAGISSQKAAQKYLKPEHYTGNRNLYDSEAAKRNAKRELFKKDAEVFDPYTGERLVLTKKEAKELS